MLEIFTSILSGGVTGLLGAGIQRFADYKTKKLEGEIELAKRKIDLELTHAEAAARVKVAEVEGAAKVEVADAEAFAASYVEPKIYSEGSQKNSAQVWLLLILDLIRGLVRPILTAYLVVLVTLVYLKAARLLNHDILLPTMAYDLVHTIVQTILYLGTTCVLWYFGVRNTQKAPKLK